MDFNDSEHEAAFRAEARAFLDAHAPADRVDYYAETDPALRALTRDSIVALIPDRAIVRAGKDDYFYQAAPLKSAYDLCDGERFEDQPTAAQCSGTLIGTDLVLTAGHCVTTLTACKSWRYVFNYVETGPNELAGLTDDDVYECKDVVASTVRMSRGRSLDYAVVRLDRPIVGHSPAPIRPPTDTLRAGDPLRVIGFPSGLPAKIDDGGQVSDPRTQQGDYFVGNPDTFAGNSGSGVFDAMGRLVGVLVRGQTDYDTDPTRGCAVAHVEPNLPGGEEMTYAVNAIRALCTADPSDAACAVLETCGDGVCAPSETASCAADCDGHTPTCGDGICEGDEPESCAADCRATVCGDGRCEVGEQSACPDDCVSGFCGDGLCDPVEQGDCDIDCPAAPAICGDSRCATGEPSTCPQDCPGVPATWTCDPAGYASGGACECGCGAWDLDCDRAAGFALGCASDERCVRATPDVSAGASAPATMCVKGGAGGGCTLASGRVGSTGAQPRLPAALAVLVLGAVLVYRRRRRGVEPR